MPNQPKTPHRTLRIPDEVWCAAVAKTRDEGTTVTAVVLEALRAYVMPPPPTDRRP